MADWIDYYGILGLDSAATPEDIDRAFRRKSLEVHPDLNKSPDANEQMKLVNQARDALKNPDQRAQFDKEWTFRNTPPLPVVEPQVIAFNDVTPGELQHGSFVVSNKGGVYDDFSALADDKSWIGFVGTESIGQQEDLPAKVTFTAVAQGWGQNLTNTIRVRLDEAEAVVRVSLHTKARPEYASSAYTSVAATPTPSPTYAPTSPPYSAPTYRTPTVTVPRRRQRRASRRFVITASLLAVTTMIVAVATIAIVVLQDVRPWEKPVWSLALEGVIRAVPIDANANNVMDEVAAISWRTRGTGSDFIRLTVIDKQGNEKSTKEILSRSNKFPQSFDNLELYSIDYDSDGVINELYLYVNNAEYHGSTAVNSTILGVFNVDGKIVSLLLICDSYTNYSIFSSSFGDTISTCSENEAAEKHSRMLTEYAYPVYGEVQNYPQTAKDWKRVLRIKEGVVESHPRSASLTYSTQEGKGGSNRNSVTTPAPSPTPVPTATPLSPEDQGLLKAAALAYATYDKSLATSPDGGKVAIVGSKGIEIRDVVTTSRVAQFVCTKVTGIPSWSPDSKKVWLAVKVRASDEWYLASPDGSEQKGPMAISMGTAP